MYSLISIIIAIPMVMFFSYTMLSDQESKTDIYRGIVAEQIAVVADSMDSDFQKAMEISGKRALIAAVNWEILKGEALTDAVYNLTELINNGTINRTDNLIMENNTLSNWSTKIAGVRTNFDTGISYGNLQIVSEGFDIFLSAEMNISVVDDIMEMRMIKNNIPKSVSINIADIDDPLFALNTYGLIHRTIFRYPYEYKSMKVLEGGYNSSGSCSGNITTNEAESSPAGKILLVSDSSEVPDAVLSGFSGVIAETDRNLSLIGLSCYNTGNGNAVFIVESVVDDSPYKSIYIDNQTKSVWHLPLRDAVENGFYFEGAGPNITNRMENKTASSANGIESIVNIQELFMEGIQMRENQVSVDYLYFTNENYIGYGVRGFPGWLRLNCAKAAEYGVGELLDYSC